MRRWAVKLVVLCPVILKTRGGRLDVGMKKGMASVSVGITDLDTLHCGPVGK